MADVGGGHAGGVEMDAVDEHVGRGHEPAGEDTGVVADPDLDAASRLPGDRRDRGHQVVL